MDSNGGLHLANFPSQRQEVHHDILRLDRVGHRLGVDASNLVGAAAASGRRQ